MYDSIRPTAYEPDPAFGTWVEDFHVIAFSEQWRSKLTELYRRRHPTREQPVALPVRQLNTLLRAAAPGVVATGRRTGNDTDVPWIYARSKVPAAVIAPLVSSWVLGRYADEDRTIEVLGSMYDEVPEWTVEPIQLGAAPLSLGGTADPERRLYSLVPEVLAARLTARPYRPADLERDIWFRIVDREQGVELVSWPPHRYLAKNRAWFYSAVIAITMHTVPFRPSYRIHVSTGIRRWTTNSTVDLTIGRSARVLLDVPLPWPDNAGERTARLIGNRIGYRRELGRVDWSRHSAVNLLPDLDIMRDFPDAVDIVREPRAWLEGRDSIAAGIVHRNGAGRHEVADGVFPGERALLDTWVEEGLRPMLRRAPDLRRTAETNKPVLLKKPSKAGDVSARAKADRTAAGARREALISCLDGRPLNIDILWQFPETRRQLLTSIAEVLGLPTGTVGSRAGTTSSRHGFHTRSSCSTWPAGSRPSPRRPTTAANDGPIRPRSSAPRSSDASGPCCTRSGTGPHYCWPTRATCAVRGTGCATVRSLWTGLGSARTTRSGWRPTDRICGSFWCATAVAEMRYRSGTPQAETMRQPGWRPGCGRRTAHRRTTGSSSASPTNHTPPVGKRTAR